jgi:diguanylate cyclase (GGDEF)-like protein
VLCDRTANVVAVNNRFLHLFDIPTVGVRPGMSVASLIRLQAAAGEWAAELTEALVHERLNRPPGASGRLVMPFRESLFEVAYQPRVEGGWACTFEDVTAQKEAERRIAHLAQHDSLTGLPNRAVLRERIDAAIAAGSAFAAMFLDLDDFKLANDTYGHAVGDALLCAVAERLRARMRLGDIVARLGGDEFAVLLIAPCSPEEADRHAAQLVRALAEPFQVEEHMLRIGVSIGISLTPNGPGFEGAPSADMLLRQADIALYRAKEDGGGAHRFFETPMTQRPFVDNAPIATAWTGA